MNILTTNGVNNVSLFGDQSLFFPMGRVEGLRLCQNRIYLIPPWSSVLLQWFSLNGSQCSLVPPWNSTRDDWSPSIPRFVVLGLRIHCSLLQRNLVSPRCLCQEYANLILEFSSNDRFKLLLFPIYGKFKLP